MNDNDIRLSIIIHRGSPLDDQIYRHTSLWIQPSSSTPLVAEILGSTGFFEFQASENDDPTQHADFVKNVEVGRVVAETEALGVGDLVNVLSKIEVRNEDREFNCQTWVERALARFRDLEWLESSQYDKAVDEMVDTIAEAEDEEQ